MSVHNDRGYWIVRYSVLDHGKYRRKTKSFGKGPEAKRAAEAFNLEQRLLRKQSKFLKAPKADITLTDLVQKYIDHLYANEQLKSAIEVKTSYNKWIFPKLGTFSVSILTMQDLAELNLDMTELSLAARQRYIGYIKAAFNWGIQNDYIDKNPWQKWKKKKEPRPEPYILTPQEIGRLLTVAPEHLKRGLYLEWYTGLRPGPSELFALQWKNVSLSTRTIKVEQPKVKHSSERSVKEVIIPDSFYPIILSWYNEWKHGKTETDYLIEYKGKAIKSYRRSWMTAKIAAGIPKHVRLYDLRHSFPTYIMESDNPDLQAVQYLMGHSTPIMTMKYGKLVRERTRRAASKIPAPIMPKEKAVFKMTNPNQAKP